jgi:signal transduction histidine kinase
MMRQQPSGRRYPRAIHLTYAICLGAFLLLITFVWMSGGMQPAMPASVAVGLLLSGGLIALAAVSVCTQNSLVFLPWGMGLTGGCMLIAGIGMLCGVINPSLLPRTMLMTTLLTSTGAGVISMNVWKEMVLRARDITGRLPKKAMHGWHAVFGVLLGASVGAPLTLSAEITGHALFTIARLIPVCAGMGMATVLLVSARPTLPLYDLGRRVAWLGIVTQFALLISATPLALAWIIALALILTQVYSIGQWAFAYQTERYRLALARAERLADLNTRLQQNTEEFEICEQLIDHAQREGQIDTFGRIAHGLGNHVNQMALGSQVLLNRARNLGDTGAIRASKGLYSRAMRMGRLLRTMVESAGSAAGHERIIRLEAFALAPMICNLVEDERVIDPRRRLEFIAEPPSDAEGYPLDDDIFVAWDHTLVEDALFNLLTNAEKYSDHDAPIEVRAWLSPHLNTVIITVADRGFGMTEETRQHIFERHFRGREHAQKVAGYGIGMAFVKEVVDHHHGTIAITTRLGGGTTVRLTLPRFLPDNQIGMPEREQA